MLSAELKRNLLFSMARIRMVEETIARRYNEWEMRCPVHLSIGQEATAVGVCAALSRQDYVMSTHRAHAHYLAKGGNLRAMIAEIYGKRTGCSSGKGGSMHLVDLDAGMLGSTPIVGSSLPVAVGTAFGSLMKNEDRVTAVFFGEGTTEEGVFAESLNFAALKRLPVLFVCENNLYSVYSPMEVRQPAERNRAAIARAHGIEGAVADGNDVQAIYELAVGAVDRARSGGGPTYLELETYRWREHCGPNYDNDAGYRADSEFLEWRKRCPVDNYKSILLREGILTESDLATWTRSAQTEIDEAFRYAKESQFPEDQDLLTDTYSIGISL